jgi:hypothetical protein
MNTKKSNLKIIIIIVVSAVILAGAGFVIYKAIDIFTREDAVVDVDPIQPNVTLFRFYMGRDIADAELDDIREIAGGAVGADKVLDISQGAIFPDVYDTEGNIVDMGARITIVFSVLEEAEWGAVFGALVDKYEITPDRHFVGVDTINRQDFPQ